MNPPDALPAFFDWLREHTERAWASLKPSDQGWQPGTKWAAPLSGSEISAAEAALGVSFPPDLRLFLKTLHTTTRPPLAIRFIGDRPQSVEVPGFYDWREGIAEAKRAVELAYEGVAPDVQRQGMWLSEWGAKPGSVQEIAQVLKRELPKSSPLIPLFGHRFLIAEPAEPGNPVLSAYGGDVIVYGNDLRSWLLREFAPLINVKPPEITRSISEVRVWGWLT